MTAPSGPPPGRAGKAWSRSDRSCALRGALALLPVVILLVFGKVCFFGFVDYDDGDYVFRNPHLLEGGLVDRVRWAFTARHAANWHPLTWLSLMADGALFGLHPGWMHAENLALHALNTILLLALLVRLTGSVGRSVFVAALFALHPLRAESVAWVTERKGLLMAFFSLLALHAHVSLAHRPSFGRHLALAVLFAGALLAKPQAVTLPFLLLLLDWWPLGRLGRRQSPVPGGQVLAEKLPLLLLAGAATLMVVAAQRQAGAVAPLAALPIGARLALAVTAPVGYLGKTLWPSELSPLYPLAPPAGATVGLGLLVLAVVTFAAVRWRCARPWLAAGWLGFLALLAPVSGLFQAGGQGMADRYTYLPHLPLFVLLVWSAADLLRKRPRLRAVAVIAALAAIALLGAAARRQTAVWRSDLELFSRAVAVTEGNWKAHYNLGNTLESLGREGEARRQYRLALEARPDYPEALSNLGALVGRRGEAALAEGLFTRAVQLSPGYGPAWFNLGFQRARSGDIAGALEAYGRAAALQPGASEPRIGMGRMLLRLGWREEALAACREAQRLDPGSAGAAACLHDASAPP